MAEVEELVDRVVGDTVVGLELLNMWLGRRLGLYRALEEGPLDANGLADETGVHPRYAREWLEQQGVAGWLKVAGEDPGGDPYLRAFALPEEAREVLLDEDSPFYLGALPELFASIAWALPEVADAYRNGGGVPFSAYGAGTRHGIGGLNRPMYLTSVGRWVGALPGVAERLSRPGGRVLDLGCGTGWSTIALAEAFPEAFVQGVDLDQASVEEAKGNAAERGLSGRVAFACADAAAFEAEEDRYDLVCVFEALHDMADPVGVLRQVRALLKPGGSVLVGDERVAESYSAPGDLLERLNYGFSTLHCLPATRAEEAKVEAGTVLRPSIVHEYALSAGFPQGSTVADIEHDLWRFYHLCTDPGPGASAERELRRPASGGTGHRAESAKPGPQASGPWVERT
ncbi:class I SAM-dependent methyltransferase [Actinocorallia sp. A-T 12471]|uniref:class I SAM-dependent methyltransferase n=1 Tax=Actinocorallia sp. A-T 12471 TaxID=3089813 RepID=UPI0029D2A42C|nr:class I SAM-dependent methyltransferase [Actinocorallia sp. A-T 12471]MDX6738778.1 class I SAM-dependent methyltransferase [Actinocorallia sp. A-T 12471]